MATMGIMTVMAVCPIRNPAPTAPATATAPVSPRQPNVATGATREAPNGNRFCGGISQAGIDSLLPKRRRNVFDPVIGESGKSWHLHGTHWYRLQQIWHPWEGQPAWTPPDDSQVNPAGFKPAPFDPNPFTPVAELAHTRWISSGEIMPTLVRAGKPGFWFGHDHVVPQAYLGMVPWLVVEEPAGTPAATEQQNKLQQLQEQHLRLVQNPGQKQPLPPMPAMPGMEATPGTEAAPHR